MSQDATPVSTADRAGETVQPAENSEAGSPEVHSSARKRSDGSGQRKKLWRLFRGESGGQRRNPWERLRRWIFAVRHGGELQQRLDYLESERQRLADEIWKLEKIATERESAQQRLRESEAKLRKIFEASVDAVAITRLSDGQYLDINEAFELSGFTQDEVLGSDVFKLNVWSDPAQQRRFIQTLKKDGRVANMEVGFRRKDGVVVPYLISASVVELGGVACVVSIAHDITELKRIQGELMEAREELSARVKALEQSERRLRDEVAEREQTQQKLLESTNALRKIIEVSPDTITVNRLTDGRYIDVYQDYGRIFGYSREEVLNSFPSKIVWVHREELREFLKQLQELGAVRNMQTEFHTKDGTVIPVEVSAALVDLEGERCVITFTKDMRERKRFERELIAAREEALRASQAKSQFLSSMSHDIRTPMNAILGMADLLWETPLNFEQRRYLDTMRSNGNVLLDLLNGILDLSRIESGRLSLELTGFDPADLVEKVLDSLAIGAHDKGLELVGRISPDIAAEVVGDPLRLRQVLVNLVSNAIKFTERGEVVLVAEAVHADSANVPDKDSSPGKQVIRFSVMDSGIGIPADKLDTIFGSFEQAEISTARRYGGSGLGLAIAKSLVELMGGKITVTSTPGQGSSFSFELSFEVRTKTRSALNRVREEIAEAGFRVLVFDDSTANRIALSQTLSGVGVSVSIADDPEEALNLIGNARASAKPFDLLLLDHSLPGADGLTLARRIPGGDPASREAIVMMLTSDALAATVTQLRLDAKLSGRCSYLVKPVKRADLFEKILDVIGQRRRSARDTAAYDSSQMRSGSVAATKPRGKTTKPAAKVVARPIRILLAEDSPDNRLLIEAYLRNTPYVLECAENGQVAIDRATSAHYDVILMDIQMPVIDGYTAVRKIREWEYEHGQRATPIIALTASALDEAVRKSFDVGCNGHVSKPVKKATLLEAIRNAVDESREASRRSSAGEDA